MKKENLKNIKKGENNMKRSLEYVMVKGDEVFEIVDVAATTHNIEDLLKIVKSKVKEGFEAAVVDLDAETYTVFEGEAFRGWFKIVANIHQHEAITRSFDDQELLGFKVERNAKTNKLVVYKKVEDDKFAKLTTLSNRQIEAVSNLYNYMMNGGIIQWRESGCSVKDRQTLMCVLKNLELLDVLEGIYILRWKQEVVKTREKSVTSYQQWSLFEELVSQVEALENEEI